MNATDIQKSLLLSLTTLVLASCGVESVPKRGKIGTGTNPIVLKEAPKENPDGSPAKGSEKSKPIDEIEIDPNEPAPEIPQGSFTWIATCAGWPKAAPNDNENESENTNERTIAEFYLNSEQPIVLVRTDDTQTYAVLKVSNEQGTDARSTSDGSSSSRTLSIEREGEFTFVLSGGVEVPTALYRGETKLAELICTTPQ